MKQIDETIDAHDGWAMEQLHSMLKEQQKPITIESIDRLLKVQQPLFNLTHILLLFCSHCRRVKTAQDVANRQFLPGFSSECQLEIGWPIRGEMSRANPSNQGEVQGTLPDWPCNRLRDHQAD